MIDISGRAVRAGIRTITAVATASCFAVMPQVAGSAYAHTGGKAARAHDHATPHRDHDGREVRDQGRDQGPYQGRDQGRGRADVVVDTRGPRGAVVPGRTYTWPFKVTNRGSVPARDVALTARPDKSLKVLAAPPKCRWRHSGPLVCRIGLLPQGQTRRGEITATVVPRARTGKALSNPIQVSWRNAPNAERMSGGFPPVEVSPGGDTPAPAADGTVPYPLTVTEHGPVTSESVVVRSPIGLPAPAGPCASGVVPGQIGGKAMPIKPAFDSCGAKLDDAAACGCVAPHDRPVADAAAGVAAPDEPAAAAADRPASTPCGVAADRPVVIRDDAVPPCALHEPAAVPDRPAAVPDRPVTVPDRPVTVPDRPVTVPSVPPAATGIDRPDTGAPVTTPCEASRPVILPAPVPDRPAMPPCAGAQDRPADEQGKPAAPAAEVNRPVTTPCEAAASRPVLVPRQPVPAAPAVPPCAQGWPNACGCQAAQTAPAAPATDAAAVPGTPAAAPCAAAEDKPMAAEGKTISERPTGPSCGAGEPPVVHEEPGVAPVTMSPMTPQAGPGKAAHRPLSRPHHHAGIPVHAPRASGRAHRDCVRQGTGFVCPLGAAPGRRPHVLNLTAPSHPRALHCAGGADAACHTRRAQPVAMRSQSAGGRLPATGGPSALLALSGVGLAGAGVVLYRLSRSRRGDEG